MKKIEDNHFDADGRFVAWCTTTKASPGAYYNTRAKLRRAGLECWIVRELAEGAMKQSQGRSPAQWALSGAYVRANRVAILGEA